MNTYKIRNTRVIDYDEIPNFIWDFYFEMVDALKSKDDLILLHPRLLFGNTSPCNGPCSGCPFDEGPCNYSLYFEWYVWLKEIKERHDAS